MRNILLTIALGLLLVGCSTTEVKYKYVEVKVPVAAEITPPPTIRKPVLPINSLTDKDKKNFPKISKAYATSIKRLKAYSEKQDKALDKYRPKKKAE